MNERLTVAAVVDAQPAGQTCRLRSLVDDVARAFFDSGPDGFSGRYDVVAERVNERNRSRFEAIVELLAARHPAEVPAEALLAVRDRMAREVNATGAGFDLGEQYIAGIRSVLGQLGDEAARLRRDRR